MKRIRYILEVDEMPLVVPGICNRLYDTNAGVKISEEELGMLTRMEDEKNRKEAIREAFSAISTISEMPEPVRKDIFGECNMAKILKSGDPAYIMEKTKCFRKERDKDEVRKVADKIGLDALEEIVGELKAEWYAFTK